ncbi:MAG: 50S ribosomal protein L29 [Bacteroidota bacterium]
MADTTKTTEFSVEDLRSELEALEVGFQKLKFDHATKGLENPLDLRNYRRDIARIKTELRKRELEGMSQEELANRSKIRARRSRQKRSK